MKGRSGIKPRTGEMRIVGRVREHLGLQRNAVTHPVEVSVFAHQGADQMVARVNLQARSGCPHFEHASGARIFKASCQFGGAGEAGVECKVVVIAAAQDNLRIPAIANALVDLSRAGEIEDRAPRRRAIPPLGSSLNPPACNGLQEWSAADPADHQRLPRPPD